MPPAPAPPTGKKVTDTPVSYTHLDVYKRQILNWTLDCGMVAIINIHHENEWIKQVPTDSKAKEKFTSIWKQICERFEKYGDHLLFEPMNEIGYDEIWTPWGGSEADKAKALGYVNDLNQLFVDIVRNSGGNNAKRHLLVEIYNTNLEYAYDPLFKMPNDPANRLALTAVSYTHLSVHAKSSKTPHSSAAVPTGRMKSSALPRCTTIR